MADQHKHDPVLKTDIVPSGISIGAFLQACEPLTWPRNILIYKHHEIQLGFISSAAMPLTIDNLTPEYVKELRLFAANGELYLWKHGQDMRYRLRVDPADKFPENCYAEQHLLWGDDVETDGKTLCDHNRGMRLTFPFSIVDKPRPFKYEVYNYYEYDANGLICFEDARLVQFVDGDNQPLGI